MSKMPETSRAGAVRMKLTDGVRTAGCDDEQTSTMVTVSALRCGRLREHAGWDGTVGTDQQGIGNRTLFSIFSLRGHKRMSSNNCNEADRTRQNLRGSPPISRLAGRQRRRRLRRHAIGDQRHVGSRLQRQMQHKHSESGTGRNVQRGLGAAYPRQHHASSGATAIRHVARVRASIYAAAMGKRWHQK